MSDTETEDQISADATDTQTDPTAVATKTRVSSTIDGSVVTVTDADGSATYDLAGIPVAAYPSLAALALRDLLIRSNDRAKTYAGLVEGNVPGRKPKQEKAASAPKELSKWRQAWAHAAAEAAVRATGAKTHIGKNPTAELKMALDDAMQRAVGVDRATLAKAMKTSVVMAHYERLTGTVAEGLF